MQIDAAALHRVQIPLKTRVEHARSARGTTDALIVVLRSTEGLSGYGEILPRTYVTGESIDGSLREVAPRLATRFLGRRFDGKDDVVSWLRSELDAAGRDLATFSGFEVALLDLAGQAFEFSAGEAVGHDAHPPSPRSPSSGFGDPDGKARPALCRPASAKLPSYQNESRPATMKCGSASSPTSSVLGWPFGWTPTASGPPKKPS